MKNKIQWALRSVKYITFGWMMSRVPPESPERCVGTSNGAPIVYVDGITGNETAEEFAIKLWQFFSK